ncbi:MAG: putative thiamine-monophosphate kinase [Planctomycetota bacterium]
MGVVSAEDDGARRYHAPVTERHLLSHIYGRSATLSREFPQVLVGPGDDCALVATPGASLLKVDMVIEGVHFVPATPVELIARKAVARAVSDIAAMAGRPLAALAACVLPRSWSGDRADALFDAAAAVAREFGCPLVGGDIAVHDGPLCLTITVIGTPHPAVTPRRGGVKAGDVLYVTGELGGSLGADRMGRHLRPVPRLEEAAWLATTLGRDLHAMMDISDGLGIDAGRMATASGVSIVLEEGRVPVHREASGPGNAIYDGEDHELLCVVPASVTLPPRCPATGVSLTRVGRAEAGPPVAWLEDLAGRRIDVSSKGFTHH